MFGVLYNDSNFNLALPSIVSSNTNGTPLQLTFPTSTTGTSTGHYTYYGIEGLSGATATKGCSEHLNISGTLDGGHNFWHSNSTGIPKLVLSIKRDYLRLDTMLKNTSGKVNLDMINNKLTIGNGTTTTTNESSYSVADSVNTSSLTSTQLIFNQVPQVKNITHQPYSPYFSPNGSHAPTSAPTNITNVYPYFGWYFKNTNAANDYIKWTFPPDDSMIVQDIYGIYLQFFNVVSTTKINITINTTSSSKRTFILPPLKANTYYTTFINISGTCPPPQNYSSSLINYGNSSTQGTYLPSQTISTINIETELSTANSREFIITKFGVITINGTQEWLLMPV